MLAATDREAGSRFLEVLGKAFSQEPPPPLSPQPLKPAKFGTAVLGQGLRRTKEGGFAPKGGQWTATKWFLESEHGAAELFCNFNFQEGKGEFSEKDPEYRAEMLEVLALLLRDGPRPERTAQTDPHLTEIGPTIGPGRRLSTKGLYLSSFRFASAGNLVIFAENDVSKGGVAYAVNPEQAGTKHELALMKGMIQYVDTGDPEARQLLIRESIPSQPGSLYSSEDAQRLWWADLVSGKSDLITGPWERPSMVGLVGKEPVSPTGRYVVVPEHRFDPQKKRSDLVLHILDRQQRTTCTVSLPGHSIEAAGWTGPAEAPELIFTPSGFEETDARYYRANPNTGEYRPLLDWDADGLVSPDRKLSARLHDNRELVITDLVTRESRVFTFHEDDRRDLCRGVFRWVSPRYLILEFSRRMFLDVETLKMNYVVPGGGQNTYTFSPDFKWALWQDAESGLFLGPIVPAG